MWIEISEERARQLAALQTEDEMLAHLKERAVNALAGANADDEKYLAAARQHYGREGELEFDDGAAVSKGDEGGAYVMGWRWVTEIEAGIPVPGGDLCDFCLRSGVEIEGTRGGKTICIECAAETPLPPEEDQP